LLADPQKLRRLMRVWPPFAAAGISMVEIADDWSRAVLRLRLRPWTANFVGTQYGGSMFSMTDPWWMILMMRRLGPDYVVWDKAAEVEFLTPGRTDVTATFEIPDDVVAQIRAEAADGERVLRWFPVDVVATDGTVIARVRKQLHIRRKPNSVG
jgi:acyl-coenzyme A thioesterase PaaI-like protein